MKTNEKLPYPCTQKAQGEEQAGQQADPSASAALTTGQALCAGSGRSADGGGVSLDDCGLQDLPDGFSKAIRD